MGETSGSIVMLCAVGWVGCGVGVIRLDSNMNIELANTEYLF